MDLWICNKFNVLPTNKDFVSLYEEQKIALYQGINLMPQLESLATGFKLSKELNKVKRKKPEDFMRKSSMNKMRKILKAQGLDGEDIEKRINEFCDRNKKIEIRDLEKKFDA